MSKRAVGYIRVSKEREDMISPENQRHAIEEHCARRGHSIVKILEDLDLSGRFWDGRQAEQAVAMIERGEADVLVVWKISRVARVLKDWSNALDRVERSGGYIESATENFDDTSTGRFGRSVIAIVAEFESKRIGESWKEAHAHRIRNGLPHHGLPRFGYDYSKETGYTVNAESGPVLHEMYLRYTSGQTLREIAAYTASEGLEPEGGWQLGTLARTLDKGFGAGYIYTKGQLVRGAHQAVITEEEWATFRARRGERNPRPRAEASDYTYSGLLRCPCGSSMSGGMAGRNTKVARYVCNDAVMKRTHKSISVTESQVEAVVLAWLEKFAAEVNAATTGIAPKPKSEGLARKKAKTEAELSRNATRLDNLTIQMLDNIVDVDEYVKLKTKLHEDKVALEARLVILKANATVQPASIAPTLLGNWDSIPPRGKRQMLSELLDHIQLHDWENGVRAGQRRIVVDEKQWD